MTLRDRTVDHAGRVVAVTVGAAIPLLVDGAGIEAGTGWAFLFTLVWLVCVQAGFTASATDLHALGTPVAAARGCLLGLVAVSSIDFLVSGPQVSAGRFVFCTVAIWALLLFWDAAYLRFFASPRRVLLVGSDGGADDLVRDLARDAAGSFLVVGVVSDDGALNVNAPLLGSLDDLNEVITRTRPDIVVLAIDRNRPAVFGQLVDSADVGFKLVELPQFYEHAFGRVPVRDLSRAWFLGILHLYQKPYSRLAKRLFDIAIASVGLLLVLPLLPFVALAVRLSGGPILFRQTRVGEHGEPFTILKFRTMRADAETAGSPIWSQGNDPRVTGAGRLLRRTRLDEIPQLWNVLRGNMSIVGPRPERPEFMEFLEVRVPYWSRRHLVKPGLTGWAQVRRGYTADAGGSMDKLSYDLWYLRHRTMLVDIAICAQTIGVLLTGSGARAVLDSEARTGSERDVVADVPRDLAQGAPKPLSPASEDVG